MNQVDYFIPTDIEKLNKHLVHEFIKDKSPVYVVWQISYLSLGDIDNNISNDLLI